MSATLLILLSESDRQTIPWAHRFAKAYGDTLGILCVTEQPSPHFDVVTDDESDLPDVVRAAQEAIGDGNGRRPALYDCRGPKRRRAILDAARELGAKRLVLDLPEREDDGDEARAVVRSLARAAPEDVLVLDVAGLREAPRRVLVPQIGGGGGFALRLAARAFAGPECPVVALADPSAEPRSNRIFAKAKSRASEDVRESIQQETPTTSLDEAVATTVRTSDFVLFDAAAADRVPRLLTRLESTRQEHPDWAFATGVARAAEAAGPGQLERLVERVRLHLPTLDRDRRRELYETLERGGTLSADFVVMMMLSAGIAAFGLVQSSASVVIGAMLVAPLMTPIVAAGMALIQANRKLFRTSMTAMASGVFGGVLAAAIVGLLSPWDDLSAEIVARGSPNLFDLGIALLSGIAAAFALARPGLAGTLVGVAIAVALVPPLASSAIAAVKGEASIAGGAALLFVTNLIAILLGAALVFRLFGLGVTRRGEPYPPWVRVAFAAIAIALVPITYVLGRGLQAQLTRGIDRPWARPLASSLRADIEARIASEGDVELVLMAESGIEHGFGVEVVLSTTGPSRREIENDIRALVARAKGEDAPVKVITLKRADDE
ncbi:MAG: DUF389 domain-containing protein [Planctomycetota bacterium]